jgi:hypothetical protein
MKKQLIETDFLVAGGGMAGVCSAIAASRLGWRVVLVQDRSVLGGNASSEVRMHIVGADVHGHRKGARETGIIDELRVEDSVRNPMRCYPLWDVILYEKVIAEPNITLLLDTDLVGVEMEYQAGAAPTARPPRTDRMYEFHGQPGRIKSARAVRNLSEDEFIITARFFADCTGDGRLGFEAGADFRIGRESKAMHGESLAQDTDDVYTLGSSILLTSRKTDGPVPFVPPPWARKFDPSKLTHGRGIHSWEYGFWWVEWGGTLDTIKDNHTTIRHELYAIALGLWDYVKNSGNYPDSANWALDWIGAIPGKRESRRFLGPHMLTQQDLLTPRPHADECAYGGWAIDLHPPRGIDALDEPPFTPTEVPNTYGIPLRCYFSRNIENLFFAGRNISATHVAFASTRVMATCAVGGQAIGAAAAFCLQTGLTPARLVEDPAQLRAYQQSLLKSDVTLPNIKSADNMATHARITASSAAENHPATLAIDGVARDQLDPRTGKLLVPHGWRSGPLADASPAWIQLSFDRPEPISEVHLTFDTGLQRELTLSASDRTTSHSIRGPQPETVRAYDVEINGDRVIRVTDNYQRKNVHRLTSGIRVRTLRLLISATWGAPEARILDITLS